MNKKNKERAIGADTEMKACFKSLSLAVGLIVLLLMFNEKIDNMVYGIILVMVVSSLLYSAVCFGQAQIDRLEEKARKHHQELQNKD